MSSAAMIRAPGGSSGQRIAEVARLQLSIQVIPVHAATPTNESQGSETHDTGRDDHACHLTGRYPDGGSDSDHE